MKKPVTIKLSIAKHNPVQYMLLVILGFAFPLGLGAYHRSVHVGESYHQFYTFPKSGARPVIVRYGGGGILHQLISPHALGGTLGLTNAGEPAKVRMRMVRVPEGLTIHWNNSHTRNFNLDTKVIERIVNPGESVSVHHTFYIGEGLRQRKVIFNGGLEISNADSGKVLLTIPIRILNTNSVPTIEQEAPCHES